MVSPSDGRSGVAGESVKYAALSDIGLRRTNNQDSYKVQLAGNEETYQQRGHLFVGADGMGAHAAGELASKLAVDTIPPYLRGSPGSVALVEHDFLLALRTLMRAALQPALTEAADTVVMRASAETK